MMRNASINHVFTSKFMLNFAQNLEQLIRTDIKEENGKTDIVLRSLSRAASQNILAEDFDLGPMSKLQKSNSDMGIAFQNRLNNTEVLIDVQENNKPATFHELPYER